MGDFHVQLMLDFGDGGGVGVVGCFCLQRGQSDAAAADARRAGSGQDVAADRTDVEAAAQQVGGTVRVGDDLAGEQLRQRDVQRGGQRLQQGDVGQAAARLP